MTRLPNFFPALPEMFLLLMACVVMVADLYVKSERRTGSFLLAQGALLGCALLSGFILVSTGGELLYSFSNLFVADVMSHERLSFVHGDIRDADLVRDVVANEIGRAHV